MAASRVIPMALRVAPLAMLAFLVTWATVDLAGIANPRWSGPLFGILVVGAVLLVGSVVFPWRWIRIIGLVAVGAAYVVAHAFVLGVQPVPAFTFVTFLIISVELRVLSDRFGPLYEASLNPTARVRIRGALGRTILRLGVAAVLSVLVPLLAADLAVAGVVPVTTIPTAILLAIALVVIVVLLALLPALERKTA